MLAFLLLFAASASAPDPSAVDRAWTVLRDGLDSKTADKRAKAVHALSVLARNAKAEEWAEKALEDPSAEVRIEAANALGQMRAYGARLKLRHALNDTDVKVVVAAANALYAMKDPA